MFLALMISLVLEILGSGLPPPDVKGFTPVLSKELEFRIDDCKTGFVGRVIEYQNPNDLNEFVRVFYRQVAIVSKRPCDEKGATQAGGRDGNSSNLNYHQKEETETLERVQQATDAFAFVQWRIVRDLRTGQDIRTGFLQSWLLEQNGNWTFSSARNLFTAIFSEPSKADTDKRINVGIKFTLAGGTHIVRVDQDDILNSAEEVANDQK